MYKITLIDKILHKLFNKHVIKTSSYGVVYCRICGKRFNELFLHEIINEEITLKVPNNFLDITLKDRFIVSKIIKNSCNNFSYLTLTKEGIGLNAKIQT